MDRLFVQYLAILLKHWKIDQKLRLKLAKADSKIQNKPLINGQRLKMWPNLRKLSQICSHCIWAIEAKRLNLSLKIQDLSAIELPRLGSLSMHLARIKMRQKDRPSSTRKYFISTIMFPYFRPDPWPYGKLKIPTKILFNYSILSTILCTNSKESRNETFCWSVYWVNYQIYPLRMFYFDHIIRLF